ncbi:hypothetical protein AOLI_G00136990 [Acnodon oligacanthus]
MSSDEKVIATSCVFCEKVGHSLPECRKLIKKTITERVKFVQEKKLCFGCLKRGHRSKHCGDRNICKTCEKRHPTCLHDNHTKEERMHARTDGVRDHDKSKDGKPDQLQDQVPSTSREATSLRVTQNGRDETAPQQSCDIGLLIGYNCPQALVPRQVVPGEENQPFAQRTDLGWSVVGYGNPCLNYGDATGVSHQVIVKQVMPGLQSSSTLTSEVHCVCRTQIKEVILPVDVIKVLESDFAERASESTNVSQEDLRFLSNFKEGIILKSDGHYEMPLPFKKDRPNLPDNKVCAIHRLKCMERKLRRDEQYNKDYKTFMQETITRGDAERVPQEYIHKTPACKEVLATIPKEECAQAATDKDMALGELQMERAVSVQWCVASDEFQFRVVIKENPLTCRGVLSTVASICDPLGSMVPFVLVGKQILQQMCRDKLSWDDTLPDDLRPQWERWIQDLQNLADVKIPRCYVPSSFKAQHYELHHFSNASLSGYGAYSYLRAVSESGEVHCSLVMGKARVAPTKVTTIQRLELSAAVVAVPTSDMLRKELEVECLQEFFWTDSMVVLGYITNEARRFHVFVANRVERIKQCTESTQWKYVASEENPADHA